MRQSAQREAETPVDQALIEPTKRTADYSRLGRDEVAALLALHKLGKTQVEIAQQLGCSHSNVSRWLDKLIDTTDLAKHTIRNSANALAERIATQANVEESLEVLDRLEVLPKRQVDGNRTGVQIIIGMPGQPAGPDPITLGYDNAGYQTQTHSESKTGQ